MPSDRDLLTTTFRCNLCNVISRGIIEHDKHLEGKRHKKNVAVATGEAAAPAAQPKKRAAISGNETKQDRKKRLEHEAVSRASLLLNPALQQRPSFTHVVLNWARATWASGPLALPSERLPSRFCSREIYLESWEPFLLEEARCALQAGLDDSTTTALCPVMVTPTHQVQEIPLADMESTLGHHNCGRKLNHRITNLLLQSSRSNPLLSHPVINLFAPITLIGLLAKTLFPKTQQRWVHSIADKISPPVATQLDFTFDPEDTPKQPNLGFTNTEQADRVTNLLRVMGLTNVFAPLVVLFGHGSTNLNNPHEVAHNCGACSGGHGGPNARVFAAMANRSEVRKLLAERGIHIPGDTWFIGAEHDTCSENIDWYDLSELPSALQPAFNKLQGDLNHARHLSAHERCRRLASAPRNPSLKAALNHIEGRAADFSQVRPELGHATNAAAVVGRRSLTQGAFFDRRVFLISYDPTQDAEGNILESILLAVSPICVGINLEYYFSTVNNERFGCGTKVPHNIVGFFGIMDGTSSDLRTGLPKQMIESHEAMRLQLLVEAKTEVLEHIYARQASLRELIDGGWIHLSAKNPDSSDIYVFERGTGFVLWQAENIELPTYEKSPNCYKDKSEPVAPALIKQSDYY